MKWYLMAFKKYAKFSDRSRRKEYWYFVLFNFIVSFAIGFIDGLIMIARGIDAESSPIGPFSAIYTLIALIPTIALATRRLHDTGRSGWWQLLVLLPVLGWLVLLYFYVKDSQTGDNAYGSNPKELVAEAAAA